MFFLGWFPPRYYHPSDVTPLKIPFFFGPAAELSFLFIFLLSVSPGTLRHRLLVSPLKDFRASLFARERFLSFS